MVKWKRRPQAGAQFAGGASHAPAKDRKDAFGRSPQLPYHYPMQRPFKGQMLERRAALLILRGASRKQFCFFGLSGALGAPKATWLHGAHPQGMILNGALK